ncbi:MULTISPECIES: hypothetical protein [Morganellaceae]|nr:MULTISPECIES: hypothetical protein [Morganellaceae]UNH40592.1 hypothetical protein MNY70_17285 [Moellerella wisconsensis]UNH44295.1 hypothetical protein MNY66_16235 [Moellerella wisconsensis]
MKKILTASLITLVMAMTGCASKPEPMPVDVNPSEALQFARAMNLFKITDAGDDYLIYNRLTEDGRALPLVTPVKAGDLGETKHTDGGLTEVALGLAINDPFSAIVGFVTDKKPRPEGDGLARIASWSDKDQEAEWKDVYADYKPAMMRMDGYNDYKGCKDQSWTFLANLSMSDTSHLPKPPKMANPGKYKAAAVSSCFYYLSAKKSNLTHFKALSAKLGDKRAVFVPGSQEHAPFVFYNGQALEFRK